MLLKKESRETKIAKQSDRNAKSKLLFALVSSVSMGLFFVAFFLNINSTPSSSIAQNPVPVVPEEKEQQVIDNIADTAIEERRSSIKREQKKDRGIKKAKPERRKTEVRNTVNPQLAINKPDQIEKAQWITCKTTNEKKEYYLPDNSKISLEANSEIKYASNFNESRILYFSGNAFFEITHKSNNLPFIIYSNITKTEVLGTSFTIKSIKGVPRDVINVITGKVAYSALNDPSRIIYLTAGKECSIKEDEEGRIIYSTTDIVEDGNKHERIVFNNTRLSEVISTLKGFYKVSILTGTPEILNCKFSGSFENSDIDEVMQVISESFNLTLVQEEGEYILNGKSCNK